MSMNKTPGKYPSYTDIVRAQRQTKFWRPFRVDGERSVAEVKAANAGVVVALLLCVAATLSTYAGALWLTNLARDALINILPGSATFAELIGMALKTLETISVAWFMKVCWTCVPYVVSKVREDEDRVF